MTTRKILLLMAATTCVVNAWWNPFHKDDKKKEEETVEPEIDPETVWPVEPEEIVPRIPQVEAGVVVSLSKQFLIDEQTQLLNRFINAINWMGQFAEYTGQLGEFVPESEYPSAEITLSKIKIQEVSNLLTTAERNIDLQEECGCISGSIRNIENIELDFDFQAYTGFISFKGQVKLELTNASLEYRLKPFVHSTDVDFHD